MKRNVRSKIILLLLLLLYSSGLWAQPPQVVPVRLMGFDGSDFVSMASKNISSFIQAVNSTYKANVDIDTSKFGMLAPNARKSLKRMWKSSPFYCKSSSVTKFVSEISHTEEYEVRGVPFYFKNKEADDHVHECSFVFDNTGMITAFHISVEQNCYNSLFETRNDDSLLDVRKRMIILDFVERVRTAYEEKNIEFLDQIYSDDALIITGRTISTGERIVTEYSNQTKEEYIEHLRPIFRSNARIRVSFSEMQLRILDERPGIYGTRIIQDWRSDRYKDSGYLYLVWDFTESDTRPKIQVRVWQNRFRPDGSPLSPEDMFDLEDVEIE